MIGRKRKPSNGESGATIGTNSNGNGAHASAPLLVIRTTHVAIRPYRDVDADFAAAEGEGDGSLGFWRAVHWDYFSRRCIALGREASPDMPVILERFALVYPTGERRSS